MKRRFSTPEIVVRYGKPSAVILDIKVYEDMLEQLEQKEDLKALADARRKPLKFRPFQDFIAERGPMYKVEISNVAEREMKRLPTKIFDRIASEIQALAQNPRPHGCVKLAGSKHDLPHSNRRLPRALRNRRSDPHRPHLMRVRHRREAYR